MISGSQFALLARRASRSLWFLPSLYAMAALLALLAAPSLEMLAPPSLVGLVSVDDINRLLGVLASSMLAVSIFALGAMVSALQAAASAATPRARPLLMQDRTAQTAISTFIGAFIFSVVGLAGAALDVFGPGGRVILFGLALALIALVVAMLIVWLQRLSNFGGVGEAVDLVERAAGEALRDLAFLPFAGGRLSDGPPPDAVAVHAGRFGHVQHIDVDRLGALAARLDCDVHLALRAGAFVHPGAVVVWLTAAVSDDDAAVARRAFVIDGARSFDHDPRFGLLALSEIASRALSPAVNDPGTAIDVIVTATRLLAGWAVADERGPPSQPRLFAPPISVEDLLGDAFRAISRDGAAMIEVAIKLHKALAVLIETDPATFAAPAIALSAEAAMRSDAAMTLEADRATVATLRRDLGLLAR